MNSEVRGKSVTELASARPTDVVSLVLVRLVVCNFRLPSELA